MKKITLLLLSLTLPLILSAQDPGVELPPVADLTPTNIFNQLIEPVYGALVIIFGYLSYAIPGVKKVAPFWRVLAFALVSGLGFFLFGAPFWKIAVTYFVASGLYDIFLKKIFKTPKAPAATR